MTFLNPAVLFGLLAAAIPVLIHLLNLRKLKRIEFSSLAFLKELQKNQVRKIRLRQWLLLLVRTLLILALVVAFARPVLRGFAIGGAASAAKTTAVFILDDSYSMSFVDQHGSWFNRAKSLVQRHLNSLQDGDNAVIIRTSDIRTRDFTLTTNLPGLAKNLEEMNVSAVSGTLHEAMVKAAAVLGSSHNFNKEIYLFTDLQKSTLIKDSLYTDLSDMLSERANLYLFGFHNGNIENIGLDSIHVNSSILARDKLLNLSVFMRNYARTDRVNVATSIFINGERAAQKAVALISGKSIEVPFEVSVKNTGHLTISASVEDDDIKADNNVYATVYVPESLEIGVFEQQKGDAKYVEAALTADDSLHVFKIETKSLTQLLSANLNKYKMICIAGAVKGAAAERVKAYVTEGNGAYIFPGTATSHQDFSEMSNALGLAPVQQLSATPGTGLAIGKINYEHPLLQGIFKQAVQKSVESPEFVKYFRIPPSGSGKAVIAFNSLENFLTEYRFGKGRMLVSSVALTPEWSTLPFKAFFVPLTFRSAFYLGTREASGERWYAGDAVSIEAHQANGKVITVSGPAQITESLHPDKIVNGSVIFTNTSVPGVYSFTAGGNTLATAAVNHNPAESLTEYMSIGEFEQYLKQIHARPRLHVISDFDRSEELIKQARYGAELWKWFIGLAVLLAILEMIIARISKKDLAH